MSEVPVDERSDRTIYCVGTGLGDATHLTSEALNALQPLLVGDEELGHAAILRARPTGDKLRLHSYLGVGATRGGAMRRVQRADCACTAAATRSSTGSTIPRVHSAARETSR